MIQYSIMRRVSIITPCHNGGKYIGRTIDSVRAQTLTDWEHVIVDDGSADNSAAVIEAYCADDRRLLLLRQSNGGPSNARNNGFAACSPDSSYLLFLDADDCLAPNMLEVMVDYLDRHSEVGLAYCGCVNIDTDDRVMGRRELPRHVPGITGVFGVRELPPEHADTPFVSVYVPAAIIPSISLLRRSVYELTPRWDEDGLWYSLGDKDLTFQMALRSKVHYVPQDLVRYRQHTSQMSRELQANGAGRKELYRKWNSMKGLTEEHKAMVEEARRFREGRVLPWLNLKWGGEHLRAGNLLEGVKHYLRCVKYILGHTIRVRLLGGWRPRTGDDIDTPKVDQGAHPS